MTCPFRSSAWSAAKSNAQTWGSKRLKRDWGFCWLSKEKRMSLSLRNSRRSEERSPCCNKFKYSKEDSFVSDCTIYLCGAPLEGFALQEHFPNNATYALLPLNTKQNLGQVCAKKMLCSEIYRTSWSNDVKSLYKFWLFWGDLYSTNSERLVDCSNSAYSKKKILLAWRPKKGKPCLNLTDAIQPQETQLPNLAVLPDALGPKA